MTSKLNQVDLAFVVDTTGSMGAFIAVARERMIATLKALTGELEVPVDLQVGVVEYRDHPPQDRSFVFRVHKFEKDLERVQERISKLVPDGGGDVPEAVYDGLRAACDQLAWRSHSQRIVVLIGDAPPHGWMRSGDGFPDGCPCGLTLDSTTALLEQQGIVLYALGLTPHVRDSFSQLAHYTGGEYFEEADAIAAIKAMLVREFGDLEFDRQVLDVCADTTDWTVDTICEALGSSRPKVSASLSRLGRRGLLDM